MAEAIQHEFVIYFPDFFREPVHVMQKAETASKAKYLNWLRFRDAYDLSFIEFLKIIKVWKFKDSDPTELTEAQPGAEP